MRAYIKGSLSAPQKNLHLTDIWFANEDADDTDVPSLDCIGLSAPEGFGCETAVSEDGLNFSCRWKEVYLDDVDENDDAYQTENFGIDQLMLMLKNSNMFLANASGFVDGDVVVTIEEVHLVDKNREVFLSKEIEFKPIEF